jgi:recombination associated protein RdgC
MDTIERARETEFLGKDFLLWLWFKSVTGHGIIDLNDADEVELRFAGKITLLSEDDETADTVTCSGVNSRFKEARFALTQGKKITSTGIRLVVDEEEYSFTLDSKWLNFRAFKTPKVLQDNSNDPDGLFYEKAGLTEKAVSAMDNLFACFIKLRISPEWKSREMPGLTAWVRAGEQRATTQ